MTEIFDDIRKLYLFKDPCPELAEYIEFFSETSPEASHRYIGTSHFTVKLFPSFTPTIWINLGSPYHVHNGLGVNYVDEKSDILVLRNTMLERINQPADHIFTIKFRPLGFESIFGISQAKIGHDIVNANEVLSAGILKKVRCFFSLDDKVRFLEQVFLEKLRKNYAGKFHIQCVKKSIDLFRTGEMATKLTELAFLLNVSEKTFNRYFHQAIGTPPKHFLSIIRCREALTRYQSDSKTFCPYDFGYYDFSHFSKDVKIFTGSTLTSKAE